MMRNAFKLHDKIRDISWSYFVLYRLLIFSDIARHENDPTDNEEYI
jgi:hypothetical protein